MPDHPFRLDDRFDRDRSVLLATALPTIAIAPLPVIGSPLAVPGSHDGGARP